MTKEQDHIGKRDDRGRGIGSGLALERIKNISSPKQSKRKNMRKYPY